MKRVRVNPPEPEPPPASSTALVHGRALVARGKGKGWRKIDIDVGQLYRLAKMGATQGEAASFFCMALNTFELRLQKDKMLREIWDRGSAEAKLSLRRLQLLHAQRPGMAGVTMAIHLSKHWLGEHDTPQMMALTQNNTTVNAQNDEGPLEVTFQFDTPMTRPRPAG